MSAIQDYLDGLGKDEKAATVAGPSGMRSAAAQSQQGAMADYMAGLGGSVTKDAPAEMTGTFRNWYTGANTSGVANGWDTGFQQVFQKGVKEAYEKGDPYGYFAQEKATGVVTWDNARSKDEKTKFTFGDVVVDGAKVANVYQDFDRHTANVMMGEYLIETGARKGQLNQAGDLNKAWDDELKRLRGQANQQAEVAPRAKAFEAAVTKEVTTDADRPAIIAGGAAGGALLGAGVASVVPVLGTAVGAVAGGLIGAAGAWLNSDSLAYQLARSQEQLKLASAEGAGWQAGLSMVAQNTMSIGMSPLANLLQGSYDVLEGQGVGKGAIGGAFQEITKTGERKASGLWQAADFGVMVGDAMLQFASPLGRMAYQAQMTTQIGSGMLGLLPGVGAWDPILVRQNNIWTRDEFNPATGQFEQKFDAGNALAGIGSVAIDAVQLGAISSLSRGVDRFAAQTRSATGITGSVVKPQLWDPLAKVNLSGEQRAALKAGAQLETRSGYKFVVTDGGEVVGKARGTLAMLAPSEGLQALSAKMLARRDMARRQGAVTAEQLYQAAADLSVGQRGLTAMLVNAVGEGQEEVVQSILDPMSQDHKIDVESVMRAGLSGAAAGFGMTAGARLGRPSQDLQMFQLGQVAHFAQTNGEELKYSDWQEMDQLQKRTLAKSASALAKTLTDGAFGKIEDDRIRGVVGGAVEAAALEDYFRDEAESALKTGATATDQASPIVMHESAVFRPEALSTSHTQLLTNQSDRTRGATIQLDELNAEIATAAKAVRDVPADPVLAERWSSLQSEQKALSEVVAASATLERTIAASVATINSAFKKGDNAAAESEVDMLNDTLEALFDMTDDSYELVMPDGSLRTVTLSDSEVFAFSKAVTRLQTRDPADSKSSWQGLMPQINKVWAFRGANGIYGVSQILLKAIRGDFDGDKTRPLNQLILNDKEFTDLRSGANILGADAMPEIGSTKFEKQLSVVVMQSWDSSNVPIRDAVHHISESIESELLERYHNITLGQTPIALTVIDDVVSAVQVALENGQDVRKVVLEMMSKRAGAELTAIGRGQYWRPGRPKLSNEMFWLANMVTRHMQEFQSAYATHTPIKGQVITGKVVSPRIAPPVTANPTATDVRTGRPLRGSTEAVTMINELPGTDLFRMFQKLHYSAWETTDHYAGWATEGDREEFARLVEYYERLSQGVLVQRLERESPSDTILRQAMTWLEQVSMDLDQLSELGITEMGDLARLANVGIRQVIYAKDDNGQTRMRYTGRQVSLSQQMLYMSLQKFKADSSQVWDTDLDRKAAYNNLIALTKPQIQGTKDSVPGNAEMAFVRVFEGVRLYDIIGVEAVSLGVQRTVGQVYRDLMGLSVEQRTEQKYSLTRTAGPYLDSKKGVTIPFSYNELIDQEVTPYKAVVDALFSAASSSLSMNLTGKNRGMPTGRLATTSNERGKAIQDTYTAVHTLLRKIAPKSEAYTAEDISRIANEFPEFGVKLMKTIPSQAMPWVFRRQDDQGRVVFASWFYEVWAQPSAEQAEMSYFRNLITNSWFAKVRALDVDFTRSEQSTEKKIAFDSLDSRMHRVIFRLASASVIDQFQLKAFMTKLNEANSVKEFMEYVNTDDGMINDGAPLLAWMDDVSVFDPERAGGGWSSNLSTPTLMEHITNLRSTTQHMIGDLGKSDTRSKKDIKTAWAIQRWHEHLKDPDNQDLEADPKDKTIYDRFVGLLRASSKRRMANGPRAMLQHTAHLVHGMYGPAHAKGQNPPQMTANAALEAQDNAFGFLTTAERIIGDLTSHNEDSVAQSPQMILRGGGRAMDRYGSQVAWDLNAVEAMLPLMLDKKSHPLMRSVLFDTVIELDTDNVARRKFLMGSTLDAVLTGSTVKDLFADDKNPTLTQSMKWLVKLEMKLRDTQKHMLEQKVTELVIVRLSSANSELSYEDIQSATVQAYMDFAALLQVVGRTKVFPGDEDPVILAHRKLKEAAMVLAVSKAYKIDPVVASGKMSNLRVPIEIQMLKPYQDRMSRLLVQAETPGLSATEEAAVRNSYAAEKAVRDAMKVKIDRMFDLHVTESIVAQYFYSTEADVASKFARQNDLIDYVYEHGELLQAAGPALVTVQAIKNHFGETPRAQKLEPFKLLDEQWEELSNVIISVEIQHLLTVSPASKPPPPYPAPLKPGTVGLDKRKFWDHSYSYLFDFLDENATDGIVAAARELAVEGGYIQKMFGEEEVIQKVKNTLLRDGTLGEFTGSIPIMAMESYKLLQGASAMPVIQMNGLIQRRWGAAMLATTRRTTDTEANSTVTLTDRDLNWMETGQFHDVMVEHGNGQFYNRPLAMMNNRFAEELSFTYGSATTPVDLMARSNVTRTWAPDAGSVPASRFKEVNITRLREEIELALKEMYPGADRMALEVMMKDVRVTMKFVNPDSQPSTAEHANSVWHEGTVYSSDGDVGDSLIEAFFYGVGALVPLGEQAALDTRKLGLSGIEDYLRPQFSEVAKLEKIGGTDFARMLALKTNVLMDTPISDGKPVDVHFYNAAYKLMKLKHWVEGVDATTGKKVRWSAEQVIEWQMAHPGASDEEVIAWQAAHPSASPQLAQAWRMTQPGINIFEHPIFPLRDAKLWIPSDQVLIDMMGDIGFGGVRGRALKKEVTTDLSKIQQYESRWTEVMESKFPIEKSQPKTLVDTDVARQAFVQDLKVSSFMTPQERTQFQRRVDAMFRQHSRAIADRMQDVQRTTFDPAKNLRNNTNTVIEYVAAMDINLGMPAELKYLTMEYSDLLSKTLEGLTEYTRAQQVRSGTYGTSFWIFQETGTSSADEGLLMKSDLGGRLKIVPGEVVFFDTAPYEHMDPNEARILAMSRIDYFINQKAALMIGSSKGRNSLISELQTKVQEEYDYQRYENDSNILVPDVFDESSFQNVAAARSRLVVPKAVPVANQRLSMLLLDQEVEENTMWVPVRPGRKTKFEAIQAVFDLFPVDVNATFNTANTSDDAEKVMRRLEGLGSEGVDMLRQEALRHLYQENGIDLKKSVTQEEADKEETDFNDSWKRFMTAMPNRVEANTTEPLVGERFGTGDFVATVNTHTGELMLYRHGYMYPKPLDFQRQLRNQIPGVSGQRGIVMYSGERAASATTHWGTVVSIEPAPGRGFRMELEIPVQELGSKIVFEHNGMKYLLTNLPKHIKVPDGKFLGDLDIDGFAGVWDTISKEALGQLGTSFGQWFTIAGIDFTQDIKKFFGTDTTDEAISWLRKIAALGNKRSVEEVYQLQSLLAGQDAYLSAISGLLAPLIADNVDITKWASKVQESTPEAAIARAMIIYLMSPGADVDAILSSSGFYVDNPSMPDAASQQMPELFTRAFDLSRADSPIRVELGRRINKRLGNDFYLDPISFELQGQVSNGRTLRGLLQYGEAYVSEDNPLLNLMAQERKESQSATYHQGLMNMIGTGGILRPKQKRLQKLSKIRQQDLTDPEQVGSMWRDLTFVDRQTSGPGSRWQNRSPSEHKFHSQSIVRYTQYRHAIDLKSDVFKEDRSAIENAIGTITHRLRLRSSQSELVHYWIRQLLYHPAEGADQEDFSGDLAPRDVLDAARVIMDNLEDGYLPTYDGAGPGFFSYPDLLVLFQANQRDSRGWAPLRKEGDTSSRARKDDLGDWIAIAFAQAINENVDFDPIYRLDMAGHMNTYQSVLRNSGYMMDITFDKEYQGKLLDPKTNELMSVTLDPVEENRLTEAVIMGTANLEYEDLMAGASSGSNTAQAAMWRARRTKALARWRARNKIRPVLVRSGRDYVRNGIVLINRDADQHSLQRIVIALRHGMAMLNPGLYFSMVPEQGFRMWLSEMTNALSGDSTLRSVSSVQRGVDRLTSSITGGRVNFEITHITAEQVRKLNSLFKTLGNDGSFTSLIIKDMMYQHPEDAPGRAVKLAERFAAVGNKWQDPTWGTTQKALARHYVEAIIRAIESTPTRNVMTIDSVIAHLNTDRAYFATHHKELHLMASNFVVDFRSLKNTPWSLAMKSVYDPWSHSENMGKRFVGTLVKLQAMYATYNMNVLTTITGMQGYTAMSAAFLDGQKKPGSLMKLWFKARNGEEITDEDYETFDMSTVIDGVTIANSFIRGGVTQTGLFMLGMVSGGVLSGEDDEAKRRRKLAQAQNAHLIMDPRRLETDFRNKDAIFLDWLPPQLSAFFKVQGDDGSQGGRAVAQLSWVVKQFLSPILGMERFFMTGDFGYITAGFADAVNSMPLFNKSRWDDVVRTSSELEALAADEQAVGTPTATKNSLYLLTSAVGLYESMLVENMFVNSLYSGLDMYDRDPTRLVLRDSDGDIQKTIENNSRPNDVALTNYVGPDGEVGQGYMKRNPLEAQMAAYTENNFTAAAVMSLFTGNKKAFMRSDMPVTMRTIKVPELSTAEAKIAVIIATLNGQKAKGTLERRLSLDEVTAALKAEVLARKDWGSYNNLDALAMKFYKSAANPVDDPLSRIGKDGIEVLTKSGHAALFKGLMGGTITLDDPEMRGISLTVDQRKALEKDFFADISREGVDLGLTKSQADSRAKRLMLGPMDDPTILGFRDILWDKRIPWTSDAKYKQLNTTYVKGPDGFPWAIGYKRGGAPGTGGFASLFGGLKRPTVGMTDAITQDGRMNSVDQVRGIDTGQRGLVPFNATELIPTDWEQTQKIIEALKDPTSTASSYVPNSNGGSGGGRGGNFYRGSGGGGYSSKGYSPTIYWSRQPTLPRGTNVFGNTARNLFWNNANIRRTVVRRERYQASRGRLNQWQ